MTRENKVYTPKELSLELKIPLRTVLRALRGGKLKLIKFSSCVFRIEGADVDDWIQTLKK